MVSIHCEGFQSVQYAQLHFQVLFMTFKVPRRVIACGVYIFPHNYLEFSEPGAYCSNGQRYIVGRNEMEFKLGFLYVCYFIKKKFKTHCGADICSLRRQLGICES